VAAQSNYLRNKLIDLYFRGVSFTAPTSLYVALFTTTPSDPGGTGGTEVSGVSYARQNLAPSTTNWAATNGATTTTNPSSGTSGTTSNNVAINFPTAGGSWGTVVGFGIYDASTSGNLLFYGSLTASQVVGSGGTVSFAISQLTAQIDN
jgi:hypothetical protein